MGGTPCKGRPAIQADDELNIGRDDNARTRASTMEELAQFANDSAELQYRVEDGVAIISLGDGSKEKLPWGTPVEEHRFSPTNVHATFRALERAQKDDTAQAVVVTAEGKFYSNGFDLHWIKKNPDQVDMLQQAVELLCAELLRYPKPTVAAINGHATAAGAMFMLAFDVKVMNKEKGFCFVPGIDLGLTYSPGMTALMTSKLPPTIHSEFITFGERFGADRLYKHGAIHDAVAANDVLTQAIKRASALKKKSKHSQTMRNIKESLYCEAIAALECLPNNELLNPEFRPMGFDAVPEGVDKPGAQNNPPAASRRAGPLKTVASPQVPEAARQSQTGVTPANMGAAPPLQSTDQHMQNTHIRAFNQRRDDLANLAKHMSD